MGSDDGGYQVYVVPAGSAALRLASPLPGWLELAGEVEPIGFSGRIPAQLSGVTVDYTITMPGTILDQGRARIAGGRWVVEYDPVALHADFPNLDLIGREDHRPGLADTVIVSLLLSGDGPSGPVWRATSVTLQGQQVHVAGQEVVAVPRRPTRRLP